MTKPDPLNRITEIAFELERLIDELDALYELVHDATRLPAKTPAP